MNSVNIVKNKHSTKEDTLHVTVTMNETKKQSPTLDGCVSKREGTTGQQHIWKLKVL